MIIFLIIIPILTCFLLQNIIGINLSLFGIIPRSESFLGIFTSWMVHLDYSHLLNNLSVLVILLFIINLTEKSKFFIFPLIVFSGGFIWLFGESNSLHIGASSLIYALFGYCLASIFYNKNLVVIGIYCIIIFYYSYLIVSGFIIKENISFAGHFGGFIIGICVKIILSKFGFDKKDFNEIH